MADHYQTLWGIHAGRSGDADGLFLRKGAIAVGWDEMGDLSAIRGATTLMALRFADQILYNDPRVGRGR
jgi:restriction system protein